MLAHAFQPVPAAPVLTFEQTAQLLSRYQWVESRLFEMMGRWVASVPEPEAKLALSAHAREHAWHADLWAERLPEPRSTAGAHLEPLMAAMAEADAPHQTIERLVGVYRVLLPHLVTDYSRHLARTSALADGPVIRALKLVLADEAEEWRRGEGLVQDLLGSSEEVYRAAAYQGRLEAMLVDSDHLVRSGRLAQSEPHAAGPQEAPDEVPGRA